MRTHPIESERIVARLPGLQHLSRAVRAEHERFDGTGYPDGLAGEAIPLASRITLVCDAYHAMVSDRPYRAAITLEQARREIARRQRDASSARPRHERCSRRCRRRPAGRPGDGAAGEGFEPSRQPQRLPSCFQGSHVRPLRHPAECLFKPIR